MGLKHRVIFSVILFSTIASHSNAQTNISDADRIHILSYQRLFSKYQTGWGILYKEFKDTANAFVIPLAFGFVTRGLKKDILQDKKLLSLNNYAVSLGFNGYEKIIKGFSYNLGLEANVGAELSKTIAQTRSGKFLISGSARTGALWIPFRELGFTVGASVFGYLSNSKIVSKDWGIEIEVGINF